MAHMGSDPVPKLLIWAVDNLSSAAIKIYDRASGVLGIKLGFEADTTRRDTDFHIDAHYIHTSGVLVYICAYMCTAR